MRSRVPAASAIIGIALMLGLSQTADAHGYEIRYRHAGAAWVPDQGGHPDPCWPLRIQKLAHPQSQYWWWRFEDCIAYYNLYTR
jgi:hypothetical protein